MLKTIIKIDEDKCVGCGLCANTCHQGAIGIVDGKAKLLKEDYCDGLGRCLPGCPTGAISFEEKEISVMNKSENVCPGKMSKTIEREEVLEEKKPMSQKSNLAQWPVQIQLVPINAQYFENANLLIAADCTAFSYGGFHEKFMKNKITLIGCPKLDTVEYTDKLTEIIKNNNIKSVSVVRMEVPCCQGIENAVKNALKNSGKFIPWKVTVISTDGEIIDEI